MPDLSGAVKVRQKRLPRLNKFTLLDRICAESIWPACSCTTEERKWSYVRGAKVAADLALLALRVDPALLLHLLADALDVVPHHLVENAAGAILVQVDLLDLVGHNHSRNIGPGVPARDRPVVSATVNV